MEAFSTWISFMDSYGLAHVKHITAKVYPSKSEEIKIFGSMDDEYFHSVLCARDMLRFLLNDREHGAWDSVKNKRVVIENPVNWLSGPSFGVPFYFLFCEIYGFAPRGYGENFVSMGEVNRYGEVLPVGDFKKKVECAVQYGFKKIWVPRDNMIIENGRFGIEDFDVPRRYLCPLDKTDHIFDLITKGYIGNGDPQILGFEANSKQ